MSLLSRNKTKNPGDLYGTYSLSVQKDAFVKLHDPAQFQERILIVWFPEYFQPYFAKKKFVINKLFFNIEKELIYAAQIKLEDVQAYSKVELAEKGLRAFVKEYILGKHSYRSFEYRVALYPIAPYADFLAVKQSERFHSLTYSTHCIVSPFPSREYYINLSLELIEHIKSGDKVGLEKILKEQYLDELVNSTLIDFVLQQSSKASSSSLTAKSIKDSYLQLIVDFLMVFREEDDD